MADGCVTPVVVVWSGRAPWPWAGVRPNPAPHGYRLRPWWIPLRVGGSYNAKVRAMLRGQSGVYAIRERGAKRPLYVGMSEAGAGPDAASPDRFWRTVKRHLQPGTGTFRKARARYGIPTEWVCPPACSSADVDLDIAVWLVPPGEAYRWETRIIGKLEPHHVHVGHEPEPSEVPF
jgi:hypothetical protein